jgi:putative hydrolase of HD superfamily
MLLNYKKGGISWKNHGIRTEQVEKRNIEITESGSEEIGRLAREIIAAARAEGMLLD